jgi:diguanylate cyclase (GGDEF)-like protein
MEETLDRELLRATRKKLPIGIIILDVDNFKRFNDTYGHAAGDAILQALGALLIGSVRREDIPTRYGGDEFVIVLPDASRAVTFQRAELICECAKRFHLPFEGQILEGITTSLGVAVFPEDGATRGTLLMVVDAALYQAKHEGRGRVVAAG